MRLETAIAIHNSLITAEDCTNATYKENKNSEEASPVYKITLVFPEKTEREAIQLVRQISRGISDDFPSSPLRRCKSRHNHKAHKYIDEVSK